MIAATAWILAGFSSKALNILLTRLRGAKPGSVNSRMYLWISTDMGFPFSEKLPCSRKCLLVDERVLRVVNIVLLDSKIYLKVMITGWWECIEYLQETSQFRCGAVVPRFTSNCVLLRVPALLLLPEGGRRRCHSWGEWFPKRISRIWAVEGWYILCGWLYIAIGYLYKCWHIVGVFGHGRRCCIAGVSQQR